MQPTVKTWIPVVYLLRDRRKAGIWGGAKPQIAFERMLCHCLWHALVFFTPALVLQPFGSVAACVTFRVNECFRGVLSKANRLRQINCVLAESLCVECDCLIKFAQGIPGSPQVTVSACFCFPPFGDF